MTLLAWGYSALGRCSTGFVAQFIRTPRGKPVQRHPSRFRLIGLGHFTWFLSAPPFKYYLILFIAKIAPYVGYRTEIIGV